MNEKKFQQDSINNISSLKRSKSDFELVKEHKPPEYNSNKINKSRSMKNLSDLDIKL